LNTTTTVTSEGEEEKQKATSPLKAKAKKISLVFRLRQPDACCPFNRPPKHSNTKPLALPPSSFQRLRSKPKVPASKYLHKNNSRRRLLMQRSSSRIDLSVIARVAVDPTLTQLAPLFLSLLNAASLHLKPELPLQPTPTSGLVSPSQTS
jgi:hypothetical protein